MKNTLFTLTTIFAFQSVVVGCGNAPISDESLEKNSSEIRNKTRSCTSNISILDTKTKQQLMQLQMTTSGTAKFVRVARVKAGNKMRDCIVAFSKNPYLTPSHECQVITQNGYRSSLRNLNHIVRNFRLSEDTNVTIKPRDMMGAGNGCGRVASSHQWIFSVKDKNKSKRIILRRMGTDSKGLYRYVSCDGSKHAKMKKVNLPSDFEAFDMIELGNEAVAFYNSRHKSYLVVGDSNNNVRCNAKTSSLRRTHFIKIDRGSDTHAFQSFTKYLGLSSISGVDVTHQVDHAERFNILPYIKFIK